MKLSFVTFIHIYGCEMTAFLDIMLLIHPLSLPQVTPGAPLPNHGHPLGLMGGEDWQKVVEKAVTQYSREKKELDLLIFTEVR